MITAILFDMDDTLLDFKWAERRAISSALTEMGLPPTEEIMQRYSVINKLQWERLERRELTRDEVLLQRFVLLFEEFGITADGMTARRTYERYLSQGHRYIPGAEELLQSLQGRYDLYLVSNGTAKVQAGRIASAGMAKYFRELFISEDIGVDKPAPGFFDFCFARMPGAERDKTIIVGDSLTSDIKGGLNAGIHTCWYNPAGLPPREDIPAEYELRALSDLPALLAKL